MESEMKYIPLLNIEIIKKAYEIVPEMIYGELTEQIREQLDRAYKRDSKPVYWVDRNGNNILITMEITTSMGQIKDTRP